MPRRARRSPRSAPTRRRGVEDRACPSSSPSSTRHAVHLEQRPDDLHVADVRDVAQHARRLAEQRRHHRLGGEVLRALDLDATASAAGRRGSRGSRRTIPVSSAFGVGCVALRSDFIRWNLTCVFEGRLGGSAPCRAGGGPGLRNGERPRPPRLAASLELRDLVFVAQREPDVVEPFEKPPPSVIVDVERNPRDRRSPRVARSRSTVIRMPGSASIAAQMPLESGLGDDTRRRAPACRSCRGRCRRTGGSARP